VCHETAHVETARATQPSEGTRWGRQGDVLFCTPCKEGDGEGAPADASWDILEALARGGYRVRQ
jgi:hypothetical protein